MKKIILSSVLVFCVSIVFAQSTEQGKQELYYQKYQTAAKTFEAVLQQKPDDGEALYGLAYAYLHNGKLEKAKQQIQQAPASVQNNPFYQAARGYVLLSEGKKDSAALYFTQALNETKEKDADVLSAIAQAEIEAKDGNANYAIELLDKAIKRDKRNAHLYVWKGNAYRKLDNGTEAFKAYQDALEKDDKIAAASYQLGNIFVTQKNEDVYLKHFQKAIDDDKNYAPAYYGLYIHHFYKDPAKAMAYFRQYVSLTDASIENDYAYTDLLYLNKQYKEAIAEADKIKLKEADSLQARIYKLLAYSTAGLGDTAKAIGFMQQYFSQEEDSNFVVKDFESMGNYFRATDNNDSAIVYLQKAAEMEKDPAAQFSYYKTLAGLAHELKNYSAEAKWLGKYYNGNKKASNVDQFNWAIAHYRAEEYAQADSVFGTYVKEHPEQGFGYYWQARSNAMMDKEMTQGLAVPYYQKLTEVMQNDTANASYKKWMVEAYGYIAAYNANTKKDYPMAISFFQKLLEVDPQNADAQKYIAVLEQRGAKDEAKTN
jgi:tetratricopeptide (TPR) repeat protein